MKTLQDSEATRKSLKPQVERRRRERMNRSLNSLKALLLQRQDETQRRVEKAEILEHTVLFLQNISGADVSRAGGGQKQSYHDGFSTCLHRAAQFLGPQGKGLWLRAALDRSDPGSPGAHVSDGAVSSSSSRLLRSSSRSILRLLMSRSGHRLCAPASTPSRGESQRPSTQRQRHHVVSRASKQSPVQSHQVSRSLWRPWP